jgi:hypothetical protein
MVLKRLEKKFGEISKRLLKGRARMTIRLRM